MFIGVRGLASSARLAIGAIALLSAALPAVAQRSIRQADYFNYIPGTCKGFAAAMKRGVRTPDYFVHSGACGHTGFQPLFDNLPHSLWGDAVRNGSLSVPFRVESYPGDPRRDAGRYCASAFGFKIELSAVIQVSKLEWRHRKKADSKCAKEWERLKRVIRDHEEEHVRHVQPILDAAAERQRRLNFVNCAASESEARRGLETIVDIGLTAWFQSIADDWDTRRSALDTTGVDHCRIDCKECGAFKVTAKSRWLVPGEANLDISAHVEDASMNEVSDGYYEGSADVTWVITAGRVGDCWGPVAAAPSQAKLTVQMDGQEKLIVDLVYQSATVNFEVICGTASGNIQIQVTPDPVTVSLPASGGDIRASQALQGQGTDSGFVTVTLKPDDDEMAPVAQVRRGLFTRRK